MNEKVGSIKGCSVFVRPDGTVRIGTLGDHPREGEVALKTRKLSLHCKPQEANVAMLEVFVAECDVVAKTELTTFIGDQEFRLIPIETPMN